MKTLKYYFIFSIALLFVQCKEKVEQKNDSKIDQEQQAITPDAKGDISVTVYNYHNNNGMRDVDIAIQKDGVTIGHDTTDAQGNATLTAVQAKNQYEFIKDGFLTQNIQFLDYNNLDKIYIYLKPDVGPASPTVNVKGIVSNSDGDPIGNITVTSNRSTTHSRSDGSYSLDIQSQATTFPVNYIQGSIQGALNLKANEDTVLVDVFIDGFTNDTITVKK